MERLRINLALHPSTAKELDAIANKRRLTRTATISQLVLEAHAREFPPVKMTTAKAYKAAEAAALAERRKASREKLLAEIGPQVALRRGAWVEWLAWFDRSVVDEFDQRMPGWIMSSPDISDADELEPKNPQGLHWATVHPNGDPRLPGNRPPLSRHASARRKGSARVMRQKAEAVGPVSASRTSIAPIDSAILPPSSARNAQRVDVTPFRVSASRRSILAVI